MGLTRAQRKRRHLLRVIRSALYRASRTFLQAGLAIITAAPLLNLDVSTLKAAAVAGIAAVLSLVQRALDESPLPTIPAG